jgi:hypothetical protein
VPLCRMKLELQQSRRSSLILYLGAVQSSIGNSKVMNLTSSCHISNLALYLWRAVLPLGSKRLKRTRLKHGYISAKGRELSELSMYEIFTLFMHIIFQFQFIISVCYINMMPTFFRSPLHVRH